MTFFQNWKDFPLFVCGTQKNSLKKNFQLRTRESPVSVIRFAMSVSFTCRCEYWISAINNWECALLQWRSINSLIYSIYWCCCIGGFEIVWNVCNLIGSFIQMCNMQNAFNVRYNGVFDRKPVYHSKLFGLSNRNLYTPISLLIASRPHYSFRIESKLDYK